MKFLRLTKDPIKWYAIRCKKCYWQGCSSGAAGGKPIADTGDYSEVICPKCYGSVNDDVRDRFNLLFYLLYLINIPINKYRFWKFERFLDKEIQKIGKKYYG